ncbi:MAG: hypothetical protein AB7N76_18465 [Planctomycetota bacterium]
MAKRKKTSERTREAARALAEVQLALRFFRLYPHEHPFCSGALERAGGLVAGFHRKHGSLEVEITRDGLFLDDEPVLGEGGDRAQSSDLPSMLFTEGIRELALEPELPAAELRRFIEVLAAPYPEGDSIAFADDLLTALWREDFEYIEYRVHDALAASFVRDLQDETALGAVAGRIRALVDQLGGTLDQDQVEREELPPELDVSHFLAEVEARAAEGGLDDIADWAARPDRVRDFLESELGHDRRLLADELRQPAVADTLGRAAEIVAWSVNASSGLVADEDAARFLAGSTLHALSRGDLDEATRMVDFATQADGGRGRLGPAVSARLSQPDGVQALTRTLETRAGQVPSRALVTEGLRYLARLDDQVIDGACTQYPSIDDQRVRAVYREFLATRVERGASAIGALARSSDQRVVKDALDLLSAAGEGSAGFTVLTQLARSSDDIGPLAQDRVDELTGEVERRRLLAIVLEGTNSGARLSAIKGLRERPTPRVYDGLLPLLEGDALVERDPQEVEAILDLLVAAGGVRATRALGQLSERRLPLFRRRAETERLRSMASDRLRALRDRK